MGAPKLLVDAAISYRANGEDRLTELFAATLHSHPGFFAAFASHMGLPDADEYQVVTQHWADAQTRVDMRITANSNHVCIGVAYVENKIDGYWFSETQVERESECLTRERAKAKRFVCIVSSSEMELLTSSATDGALATFRDFDTSLRWLDVARLALKVGHEWGVPWGGKEWRVKSLEPQAPAAQRVLHEFITYLAEDEMPDPISNDDLRVFSVADDVSDRIEGLLEDAAFAAAPWVPLVIRARGDEILYPDDLGDRTLRCVNFDPPEGHWLSATEQVDITVALDPGPPQPDVDEAGPVLYAGPYLARRLASQARADPQWLAAAAKLGFTPIEYPEGLWPCRAVLLSAFAQEQDFERQAAQIGDWIRDAIEAIHSFPSPSGTA